MPLSKLLRHIEYRLLQGNINTCITGITCDSRQAVTGFLFVALPGTKTDGHHYIQAALDRGAAAVLIQTGKEESLPSGIPTAIAVPDTYQALAAVATNFYNSPALALSLTGVTGTNGKSTTAHLVNIIHQAAGFSSGLIGTIAYHIGDEVLPAPHTTPQAPDLQALLAEMRDRGISHVTMEVSSHALDQYRADGCRFRTTVFTNLTRDHLDYHIHEEAYLAAKMRLFADPGFLYPDGERTNVINNDDPVGERIAACAFGKVMTYGIDSDAQVRAAEVHFSPTATEFMLHTPLGNRKMKLGLLGRFNVYNALAAIGAALAEGIPLDLVASVLETAQPPVGRFQRVPSDDYAVIVDYAHTPDGLQQVLSTARSICKGRVITVFGCGGDRDPGKRPLMGEIVSRLSDVCVVTSDNPRSEDPQAIIDQILVGIPQDYAGTRLVEPDRAKAIHMAIAEAKKDDLVILAGKGHETYQLIGGQKIHFDDHEVAEEALRGKG